MECANRVPTEGIPSEVFASLKSARSVVLTRQGAVYRKGVIWNPRHPMGVLLRPIQCGICQSDVKEVQGQRFGPSQFGHEVVGEVVNGWGERLFRPGQLVCLDPNIPVNRSTGFATCLPIDGTPDMMRRSLFKVPSHNYRSQNRLVFTEPFACALHAIERVRGVLSRASLQDMRIAVIGAGLAGILIALGAERDGAVVSLLNDSHDRLDRFASLSLSSEITTAAIESGYFQRLQGAADVTVIASRFIDQRRWHQAVYTVRDGGLILLYGGTSPVDSFLVDGVRLDAVRRFELTEEIVINGKRIQVVGTYGATPAAFRCAIAILADSRAEVPLERLVERRITLEALPSALRMACTVRQLGKTIVCFDEVIT